MGKKSKFAAKVRHQYQKALKKEDKAQILNINEITPRLRLILKILNKEIEVLEVQKQIQGEVFKKIEKNQRDYILQEQMKTIQQELGKEAETSEVKTLQDQGWTWEPLDKGGILRMNYSGSPEAEILL